MTNAAASSLEIARLTCREELIGTKMRSHSRASAKSQRCRIYLLDIICAPFQPETKGKPLPV